MNTNRKLVTFTPRDFVSRSLPVSFGAMALLCAATMVCAQTPAPSSNSTASADGQGQINSTEVAQPQPAATLSADELASLVGPIALYPDPLLFQVLAASTYPLEIIQLKQWLGKNKNLEGKELAEAVSRQNWDPSVQALAPFPILLDKLANDIQWTTDLGNAFLAQQSDMMDAVQSLRAVAQKNGVLKTNDKQKVGTESTDDGKQAITIESAQREVVYVPTYNTKYVYRNSGYSDDSSYSSGYSSGYSGYSGYSGSSGYSDDGYSYVGYALGAAYGAAYGYYNWRDRSGYTNGDNYYVKNYNNSGNSYRNMGNNNGNNSFRNIGNGNGNSSFRNTANNASQALNQGGGRWEHDPTHRGGAPYGSSNLSKQFGQGNNRFGDSRFGNPTTQLGKTGAPSQANNFARAAGGAHLGSKAPNPGAANRIGNRAPANFPGTGHGGAFSAPRGDVARAFSARGAQSMAPGGFRGGPPHGLNAGGPSMGGFHGGPPAGGFPGGGPPMHGGLPPGGPPMGGGLPPGGPPMGGAPPPPPPPPPP